MRIVDLAEFGKGNLRAGNWSRTSDVGYDDKSNIVRRVCIFHYHTLMLSYEEINGRYAASVNWALGHGSVSDQNGMNILFKALNLPYYYSRKGGADIS